MTSTKSSSKSKKILVATAAIAAGIGIYSLLHKGGTTNTEPIQVVGVAPKDFHGIPPEGTGGDPNLNREKNRWAAPAAIEEMSVAQVIALPHDELSAMGRESRSRWSSAAAEQASANENRGVQVVGYLAHAKESGAEACNGKSDVYHDFHIWITASPGEDKRNGIVVEAIPFWKEQFPSWQLKAFENLASNNAKVRVSGWILWDEEHGDEVGKSRGSLWEVHPVTKFEVSSGGKWEDLQIGVIP
jgi:hypothetical protein